MCMKFKRTNMILHEKRMKEEEEEEWTQCTQGHFTAELKHTV